MSSYGSPPPPPAPYSGQPYGAAAPGTPAPPNHMVLAIVSILFFWPVAIAAIINASRVSTLWSAGNAPEAQQASAKAKKLALIAIIVGVVIGVLYVIALVALGMAGSGSST